MSKIAVIQLDTETLRAVYGIEELLVQPSVTLSAAYAVPRAHRTDTNGEGESSTAPATTSASSSSISGWIVGTQLDTARASGDFADKWEVRWPFRSGGGAAGEEDWTGREFVLKHLLTLFNTPTPPTSLILVPPPSQSNPISTLELYTQLAFESLGIAYLSILPASLAASYALNTTSGVAVHLGKHASHVSVVVDSIVRNEWSTVAPVGLAHCEAYTRRLLGEDKAVERELALAAGKVQDDEAGAGEDAVDGPGADGIKWERGEKDKLLDELNEAFWRGVFSGDVEVDVLTASGQKVVIQGKEEDDEGAFDVAKRLVGDPPTAANPNKSKKSQAAQVAAQQKATAQAVQAAQAAQAAADADVVLVTLPSLSKEVKVGTVRNRLVEPLFRGVDGGESVVEAMGRAIARAGVEGLAIWDGVGVVGDLAGITTLAPALTTFLSPFLVSSSDIPTDVQPTKVRLLSIPDYFVNYKGESGDLAPFLGASMAAKALLSDPGLSVNKIQYNSMGPAAIHATREEAK